MEKLIDMLLWVLVGGIFSLIFLSAGELIIYFIYLIFKGRG